MELRNKIVKLAGMKDLGRLGDVDFSGIRIFRWTEPAESLKLV